MNLFHRVTVIHFAISFLVCAPLRGGGAALSSSKERDNQDKTKRINEKSSKTGLRGTGAVDDKLKRIVGGTAETESNDTERVLEIYPSSCTDYSSEWHDSGGPQYNCAWYENTSQSCSNYGSFFANEGFTANEACCVCGGGRDSVGSPPGGFNGESFSIIVSRFNDDCMGVNSADGNNIVVWVCTIGNYQKWKFDNGKIKNLKVDGLCLDWNEDNDNVTMQTCSGRSNQDWFTEFTDSGAIFRVSSPTEGPCLTLDLSGSYTNVKVENCRGTENQKFDEIISD